MKGLNGEMFGSFRHATSTPDVSLVASPRHLPSEEATKRQEFKFTLPDNERKKVIDSVDPLQFVSPDFLRYYVVRQEDHTFDQIATIGSKLCASLSVAEHIILYLSKSELDLLVAEMKTKNLRTIPDAFKKGNGVLAETFFKSNRTFEYAIFIRANNPTALQNNDSYIFSYKKQGSRTPFIEQGKKNPINEI